MRIAMISEHASPLALLGGVDAGGQNLHVAELAAALAAQGHDVRVYTRRDRPEPPDLVRYRPGVTVEHVPAGPHRALPKDDLLPYMREFGEYLRRRWQDTWVPDVAHAHFWMSGLAALTARGSLGPPLALTYHALGSVKRRHQGPADTSPPQRIRAERMLGNRVDRVIAQCTEERAELLAMGVSPSQISIIPSGVDTDGFYPDGETVPVDADVPRILAVGRLVERKGYADLIEALPGVPGAELVIVGGPPASRVEADPLARRLRALADSLGVGDRVRLAGAASRARMPAWYRSAAVVACPAWYEPFGLTPLEAMACGVPVVGYAVGGFRDTVVDGRTGLLVPPRDVGRLADALRTLISRPALRHRYGRAGLHRVHEKYLWSHTATQLVDVYGRLARPAPVRLATRPALTAEAVTAP